jgi:heterodisulfide reductase subunit C
MAVKEGNMGEAHKRGASYLVKTGHLVPLAPEFKDLRKKVGLPEVPPTTQHNKEALEELQKIIKVTKFDKLIGLGGD